MHTLKRRDFFKRLGIGLSAAVAAPVIVDTLKANSPTVKETPFSSMYLGTTPGSKYNNEKLSSLYTLVRVKTHEFLQLGDKVSIDPSTGEVFKTIGNGAVFGIVLCIDSYSAANAPIIQTVTVQVMEGRF
jgi:hypothetical protein